MSNSMFIGTWWALVPPVLAIVLAFITKEVYSSLFVGILIGGIFYTVGGVIYALKLPQFNARHRYFGSHEIFHLFVMGGSACHFVVMYCFVAPMPL